MGRHDRSPEDILAGGRIVGQAKCPEIKIQNPDGSVDAFPLVTTHLFSENALNALAQVIGNVVEQVLVTHGLISASSSPTPIPQDHAVA